MNFRVFETIDGFQLIVRHNKSSIVFELNETIQTNDYSFLFKFKNEVFKELFKYIELISMKSWPNIKYKEADSMASDYNEYYDINFDNNGYLTIKQNELFIERPSLDSLRLFKLNKRKTESFIYDYKNIYEVN